ncbi:hypothetical protein [Pseudomonas borbori]|uniref:Ribosomal protein L7/L12 C-terminal domain-containing protein n=1 Tax=Pseudomonas borbori TaxID=289003 RepID=A0A1I5WH89_9PSED|nr:hypothetical protein [Pseudomonas borbori]SFQ18786.1 hypothetical protein SAMN05216190_13928 [Pseudomonas borbori]
MNEFPKEMPHEVIRALERGRKMEAIELLRENQGLSLKEAKEAVECYLLEHPHLRRSRGTLGGHGLWFWLTLILLLGLLILFSGRLSAGIEGRGQPPAGVAMTDCGFS